MIEQLRNSSRYEEELQRLKTGAPAYTTSCFATVQQIGEWAAREYCRLLVLQERSSYCGGAVG